MQEQRGRFDRMANRHENGTAPRAVAAWQLFQTPPELATRLVASLNLREGERVLEPSAGLGRLIKAALPYGPGKLTACEIAPQCAAELFRLEREGLTLIQRDFLTVDPEETGLFDAVAMNPPFHMREDIRHINHALTFLRPGGRLAAVCMDTEHRERALRPIADTWEKLPPQTFKAEGTQVPCVLLTITA